MARKTRVLKKKLLKSTRKFKKLKRKTIKRKTIKRKRTGRKTKKGGAPKSAPKSASKSASRGVVKSRTQNPTNLSLTSDAAGNVVAETERLSRAEQRLKDANTAKENLEREKARRIAAEEEAVQADAIERLEIETIIKETVESEHIEPGKYYSPEQAAEIASYGVDLWNTFIKIPEAIASKQEIEDKILDWFDKTGPANAKIAIDTAMSNMRIKYTIPSLLEGFDLVLYKQSLSGTKLERFLKQEVTRTKKKDDKYQLEKAALEKKYEEFMTDEPNKPPKSDVEKAAATVYVDMAWIAMNEQIQQLVKNDPDGLQPPNYLPKTTEQVSQSVGVIDELKNNPSQCEPLTSRNSVSSMGSQTTIYSTDGKKIEVILDPEPVGPEADAIVAEAKKRESNRNRWIKALWHTHLESTIFTSMIETINNWLPTRGKQGNQPTLNSIISAYSKVPIVLDVDIHLLIDLFQNRLTELNHSNTIPYFLNYSLNKLFEDNVLNQIRIQARIHIPELPMLTTSCSNSQGLSRMASQDLSGFMDSSQGGGQRRRIKRLSRKH